jgi:hypothetical protein
VLAPVEFDGDTVGGPETVDGERAERVVAQRELDAVLDQQLAEAAFELAAGLAVAGGVGLERGSEVGGASRAARSLATALRARSGTAAPE